MTDLHIGNQRDTEANMNQYTWICGGQQYITFAHSLEEAKYNLKKYYDNEQLDKYLFKSNPIISTMPIGFVFREPETIIELRPKKLSVALIVLPEVIMIPIAKCRYDRNRPYYEATVRNLVESIRERGQDYPISVEKRPKTYFIKDGNHRLIAMARCGYKEIGAIVS